MYLVNSTNLIGSDLIQQGPGLLCGVVLTADTDNAWVTIYDRGEQLDGRYAGIADRRALGPVLLRLAARAGTSAVFVPSFGVRCVHGLYAEISGGPSVCVYSIPFDYMGLISGKYSMG